MRNVCGGKTKTLLAVLTLSCGPIHAQVYAYFPADPATLSYYSDYKTYVKGQASVAGITVAIPWGTYDIGNDGGPILNTTTLGTLEGDLNSTISSGQKINLIIVAASGGVGVGGINTATPSYVFDALFASGCCSGAGPVDICFCNNYQGSSASGWTNPTVGSNCYNQGNFHTLTGLTWDNSGVPAAWEQPFVNAYTRWLAKFLSQIKTDLGSKLGYIRIGVGTGGGSYIACPAVEAGSYSYGGVMQASFAATPLCSSPCNVKPTWHNYNNSIYSSAYGDVSGVALEASMYGGNTLGMGDGNTPISWADDVAATAIANHFGIGAESLQLSDLANYASGTACSNDWCSLFNQYSLSAPPIQGLQTLNQSNPDCITNPSCGDPTGSLVTVLPFGTQRHATAFEIAYLDLLCAYDSGYSSTMCASGSSNRASYSGTLTAASSGQPSSTTAIGGKAKLSPGASLP